MSNVYLIGMMGCGKSTCAGLLGRRLGREVLDTDQEIVRQTGMTVGDVFAQCGEAHFRELETACCKVLAQRKGLVVATGGGLPLREENRRLLRSSGTVVFLNRDPAEIFATADMSGRPLGQQGKEAFLERFAQRLPLYRACAHVEITNFRSVRQTVTEILMKLEGYI